MLELLLFWFGCSIFAVIYLSIMDYKDQGYIRVGDCLIGLVLSFLGPITLIGTIVIELDEINFDFLDYKLFEKKND